MKKITFVILLSTFLFSCRQQASNETSIKNTSIIKNEITNNRTTVIVFLLPDCPASQNYTLTLNQFFEKYKTEKIRFYGVFPSFVKKEQVVTFQKEYKIQFPLLTDDKDLLVKGIHGHIAPEAFVFNSQNDLLYQGRIDDWMYAVGQKRTVITHHELQDALDAIVAGEKITVAKTEAVGCIID